MGMSFMDCHSLLTQCESGWQHPLVSRGKALQSPFPRLTQCPGVGARSETRLVCFHSQACFGGREARPSSLPDANGEGVAVGKRRLSRKSG